MSTLISTTEPLKIVAGSTAKWKKYYQDYLPSNGWTLCYKFISPCGDQQQIYSTDNGDQYHLITISTTASALFIAKEYKWQLLAQTGSPISESYYLGSGQLQVIPDYGGTPQDTRSHVKKVLDALESLLEGRASKDVLSYSIAGRSLTKMSPRELREWRSEYARLYKAEQRVEKRQAGGNPQNTVQVRF